MVKKNKQKKEVRFMAVGDMMFCCELGEKLRASNDYDFPFAKIKDFISQADFLYGNLETMITAKHRAEKFARPGLYYADPPVSEAISRARFNAVNLAHNHLYDFGAEAVELTMQLLSEAGVMYHGVGRNAREARQALEVEINGLMLGMLSYCSASTAIDKKHKYVTCPIDLRTIHKDVSGLSKRVDIVSVTLHEGACSYPSPPHRKCAKVAIDAGAKLVLSHHPHVINGVEEYNGGVIAYGLGNFVVYFTDEKFRRTFVLDCLLKPDRTIKYNIVPVWINDYFQPEIAEGLRKDSISTYIDELCRKLYTGESDREYWHEMSSSFIAGNFREIARSLRAEGISVILRKIKRVRPHHFKLFLNSVFGKMLLRRQGKTKEE
jgi:poly-gamma-glutamate synthesis protein (capsule biosynthesis protein)